MDKEFDKFTAWMLRNPFDLKSDREYVLVSLLHTPSQPPRDHLVDYNGDRNKGQYAYPSPGKPVSIFREESSLPPFRKVNKRLNPD